MLFGFADQNPTPNPNAPGGSAKARGSAAQRGPATPKPTAGRAPAAAQAGNQAQKAGAADDAVVAEEDMEEEEPGEVGEALTAVAPWAISALVHVALVLLAIWAVWYNIKKPLQQEIIIPDAKLTDKPGSPLKMTQTKKMSKSAQRRRTITKTQTQSKSTLNTKVKTNTRVLGVLGGASGKSSPFGASFSTGGPFQSSLYGNGGNAKRIAYLIDASGSLIDTLPFVIMELKRSISGLSDKQSFCVIFFQGEDAIEARGATRSYGLLPADARNKQAVMKWIDPTSGHIVPAGISNPLPAIKKALKYKPQLVYILSDNITGSGRFEMDQKTLIQEVRSANVAQTKINTIQFLHDDPLVKVGMGRTLEKISQATGGRFKFVDARTLGLE